MLRARWWRGLDSYRRAEFRHLLEHAPTESLVALAEGLAGLDRAARELHAERVATGSPPTPANK
jgi:hypothetical protein